jgi:NADPH2:quinone reductase
VLASGLQYGEAVLVTGATGGVGSLLLPLLAAAGAHVIATAGAADDGYVRGLGASEVIDYHAVDTAEETLRRHPAGLDAVINLALRGAALAGVARTIRPGGRLLTIVFPAPDPVTLGRPDLSAENVFTRARSGDLDLLAGQARSDALPVTVGRRYQLEGGAQACTDLLRAHTRGKLVIAGNESAYLG